ncbi:organomercurial lyase [Sulfurirhabdus autotrophica]|uniref:Alkylmercury lyase-like protein n=1 Tax=Sulfurirhabdus autotrophica TaxID=1706046 RepID=A0A4R3YCK3_9PROT|nr:organomercurial lyase [Sulfurirhabdus autotrophica]TCV89542.1 alkylmercury lyase-like protein [Sulfurirhabdus autotrophica]
MKIRNNIINDVKRLRREFPLQDRIESIEVRTTNTYTSVLNSWIKDGVAPLPDAIPPDDLETLLTLDAVVMTNSGIGCYPFSAAKTSISANYREHQIYAMNAIDALAIPLLTGTEVVIKSRCSRCALSLTIKSDSLGQIKEATPSDTQVEYRQISANHTSCCNDLCPGITFICGSCAEITINQNDLITLKEASVVGRAFYHFQLCLTNPSIPNTMPLDAV